MKKLIISILLLMPGYVLAAGGVHYLYDDPDIDLSDKAAMQRGAKVFVNYCLSCHSAKYLRYNRMGRDLGIDEELLKQNLMFATDKVHDPMTVALKPEDAKRWFGVVPPDLSVIARARGSQWLYNYLLGFYRDDSRPVGVNNVVFKDVGMPHVLWELQGMQEPVYETSTDAEGKQVQHLTGLKVVEPGKQSEEEYQQTVHDLVSFMVYMGEPAGAFRKKLGFWVLGFLILLLIPAYLMKKEYWKDVH